MLSTHANHWPLKQEDAHTLKALSTCSRSRMRLSLSGCAATSDRTTSPVSPASGQGPPATPKEVRGVLCAEQGVPPLEKPPLPYMPRDRMTGVRALGSCAGERLFPGSGRVGG